MGKTPKRRREFFFRQGAQLMHRLQPKLTTATPKLCLKSSIAGETHFLRIFINNVKIYYDIKLYQKVIRFVVELLIEF